jgi:hypothetical protein
LESWTAAADPALDAAVMRAAAAVGERIDGNIGDRDHVLRYLRHAYDPIEAQGRAGDCASWRVYPVDRSAMTARRLEVVTHGGSSTAFANPTATCLRDPSGGDAVMVTMFLPVEGAAAGEAGSLLYHVAVDKSASPIYVSGALQLPGLSSQDAEPAQPRQLLVGSRGGGGSVGGQQVQAGGGVAGAMIPAGFCGGSIAWKAGWSHGTQRQFPPGPEALSARAA